jgi:hypothetical protein
MPSFIAEKLALARRQLQSARNNARQRDIETAANRAFLAAENASAAAIAKSGRHARPIHDQIRTDFEELCDRGSIPVRFRNLLAESYRYRLRGDYGRRLQSGRIIPDLTPYAVQRIIERVADLIEVVARIPTHRPRA